MSEPIEPVRMPKARWLALALGLLAVAPIACNEALYRIGFAQRVREPPEPPEPLPLLISEATWVSLGETGPRQMRPRRPWDLPWFLQRRATQPRSVRTAEFLARHAWLGDAHPRRCGSLCFNAHDIWFSRHWSADQAIAYWFSHRYFAHRTWGIKGAERLFGKPLGQFDAEEAARALVLADSPFTPIETLRLRRDEILRGLRARGTIDEPTLQAALARPLGAAQ